MTLLLLSSGCSLLDVGGIVTTPTHGEKKVPAEFDIRANVDAENTVLVLVEGGPMRVAGISFQKDLALLISKYLQQKAKIKPAFTDSNALALLIPASMPQQTGISIPEIGQKVGAKWVLHVIIEDYNLYRMHDNSYYSGSLATRSFLYDAETGKKVWPVDIDGKYIVNKVELETKGDQAAIERLEMAAGYCITRYLYDCKEDAFRVADEVEQEDMKYFR